MSSSLELQYLSGESEHVSLTQDSPISIGSGFSNDVCIDEAGVEKVHCRIQWKGNGYELKCASSAGVEINGQMVKDARLSDGDEISLGSVDIKVNIDAAESGPDVSAAIFENEDDAMVLTPESGNKAPMAELLDDDDDLFEDDEPSSADKSTDSKNEKDDPKTDEKKGDDKDSAKEAEPPPKPTLDALRSQTSRQRLRPSERETVRSPFVLALVGCAGILTLAAVSFWFIIGRETAEREYKFAEDFKNEGKFNQAVQQYDKFLQTFPDHELAEKAEFEQGQSKIEANLTGGTPKYADVVTELEAYIAKFREREQFKEQRPMLQEYARQIALGAAETAEKRADAALLDVSMAAEKLHARYMDREKPPEQAIAKIDAAQKAAAAAILKQETFDGQTARINAALNAKPPKTVEALEIRRELLRAYPDLTNSQKVKALTETILTKEKDSVSVTSIDRDATTDPLPVGGGKAISLVVHNRSTTDEKRSGRTVPAVAGNSLYGIDTTTGEPVWRFAAGRNLPFFPIAVQTSIEGYLLYAPRLQEMVLVDRASGELAWRQPIESRPSGPPALHQGQLYQTTIDGKLYKISVETGRISRVLNFTQPLLGPPAFVANSDHVVIFGEQALAYTVSINPLECISVTETAHAPGSIKAPALRMENFILIAENAKTDSSVLKVFRLNGETNRLDLLARSKIEGHVLHPMALRGTQLLVPSGDELVTAFTVSDAVGQEILSPIGRPDITPARPAPIYLTLGPDGLFWMGSTALRKLQVGTESVALSERALAPGIYTQPLQPIGERMFAGRLQPYSDAVHFSLLNRDEMAGFGRAILGAPVLTTSEVNGNLFAVTSGGHLFRLLPNEIDQDFKTDYLLQIELLPQKFEEQMQMIGVESGNLQATTLDDGRMAVWCGKPLPRVWVVNSRGEFDIQQGVQINRQPAPLHTSPVLLDSGLILPIDGRLRVAKLSASQPNVEEFLTVAGAGNNADWQHLVRFDGTNFLAVDTNGLMRKMQYRQSPKPHIAEASRYELPSPIDVRPVIAGKRIYVATPDGKLIEMDGDSWDILNQVDLPGTPTGSLHAAAGKIVVEVNSGQLHAFTPNGLKQVWQDPVPLGFGGSSGAPIELDGKWVVSTRSGNVLQVDPASGDVLQQITLREQLTSGPLLYKDRLYVPTIDGSLRRIPELEKTAAESPAGN